MIESGIHYIAIWNFHSGELLNRIKLFYYSDGSFLYLNNEYILTGCKNHKYFNLLELKTGKAIKKVLTSHDNYTTTLQKINHPFYVECIISQGENKDKIKLW